MFCPNCGQSNSEGTSFCSKCGRPLNGENGQQPMYQVGHAPIAYRSIGMAIFLSLITCGIYGIVWTINMVNDLNTASDHPNDTSGGMVLLLGIVTCGIYYFFWFYKAGEKVSQMQRKYTGQCNSDNSVTYLILSIVGLSIVSMALIQSELNKVASKN